MQDGDYATAGVWVAIIILIAFLIVFFMNLVSGKNTKHITANKVKITFDNIKIILPTNNTFYVGELLQKN